MVLDEVAADEHSRAPQPCLAVNGQRPCTIVTFCSALHWQRSTLCIVCLNAHAKLLVELLQDVNLCLTLRCLCPPPLDPHFSDVFFLMLVSPICAICNLSLYAIVVIEMKAQLSTSAECYLRQVH